MVSPSITRLDLIDSFNFSELLRTLSQLRSLTILIEQDDPGGYEEWFADAATALQQLTSLVQDWHTACVPVEVASMTNLRRLRVHDWIAVDPFDELGGLALPLPGAWSGGLVALAIDSTVALHPGSQATLRSMSSLQTLQLYCWKEDLAAENAARWAGFLEAVGAMSRSRLQRLELIQDRQAVFMNAELAAALLAMSASRRTLAISVVKDAEHYCVRRWRERWEAEGEGAGS